MAAQVLTHRQVTFATETAHQAQQRKSLLNGTVRKEHVLSGKRRSWNNYGAIELQKKTQRLMPTTFGETPRGRRSIIPQTFFHHEGFDIEDEIDLGEAFEPNSDLQMGYVMAAGRKKDDVMFEAMDGAAKDGEEGATDIAFDTTNQVIDNAGAQVMTKEKITQSRRILRAADNDEEMEWFAVIHPNQVESILNDTTLTSRDFLKAEMLEDGEVGVKWLGFTWITSTRVGSSATDLNFTWFYTLDAMLLGTFKALRVIQVDRPDLNNATQVSIYGTMSSVRQFENQIVRCNSKAETAIT